MAKLDELIQELCPNGVEYKTLDKVLLDSFWIMPSTPKFQISGIPYITSKNIKLKILNLWHILMQHRLHLI